MIKKAITWIWITILALPAIMVFNDDYDVWYINYFGLMYCYLLIKYWNKLTTQWMRDYWDKLDEDTEDDFYE